jgi:hypothetical protein
MMEFWESIFRDKQTIWGFEPADAAVEIAELFQQLGLRKSSSPALAMEEMPKYLPTGV